SGSEPFQVRRFARIRTEAPVAGEMGQPGTVVAPAAAAIAIPTEPLPPPTRLPRPLAPSGVSAVLEDSGDIASRSPFAASRAGSIAALARGSMIHRLLQVLPGVPAEERRTVLARYLARALPAEQSDAAAATETQVLAVLQDPRFAPVF